MYTHMHVLLLLVLSLNQQVQNFVRALPLDKLLTETDAPYLAPDSQRL